LHANREFDVIVAGAGPAGTAAAITAARMGARILLLEQGHFPRQKVCGEFVSAESLELLRQLLVHVPEGRTLVENAPRIESARMFIQRSVVEIPVQPSVSIPRYAMDEVLWRAAQAVGVECQDGVSVDNIQRVRQFEVSSSMGSYFATSAIAATGRWSKLRQPIANKNAKKLIGLKAHYREVNPELSTDLYFFPGGYCGVQPVDGETINVCSLVRADVATQLEDVLEKHPALAERARNWTRVTEPVYTAPLVFAEPQPERDGVLFAGDTAGFIDPFAGDGISLALRTGTAAAQATMHVIAGSVSVEEAARNYRRRYAQEFLPAFRAAAHARRLIGCPRPLPRFALQFLRVPWIARSVFARTRGVAA
jgi:flavin-dependent dehydrogenase